MKHKIKMIGLDLDGTLLNTQKEMTPYTKAVLEEALDRGIVVLVSTGRPISAISKELLSLRGMKYAVTSNGARVLDVETGEVISASTLPIAQAEEMFHLLEEFDTVHEFFREGVGYTSKNIDQIYDYVIYPSMAEYFLKTRVRVEDVLKALHENEKPIDKVQWVFKSQEERVQARKKLQQIPGIEITDAIGNNLEINKVGVNKGTALLQLGERLGIAREEIMACGDSSNDYQMLKEVGFSVAMGNADEALKEIADYVTVSNDEDGVAKAIAKFVLNA